MTSHTGMEDKDYNLVSALYHALSGGDSCIKYAEDAKKADDQELADFFNEALDQYRGLAEKAKKLSKSRL
jgi:hypothetical protein